MANFAKSKQIDAPKTICGDEFATVPISKNAFWSQQRFATFQRIMNDFITSEGLLDTFAYLDNVTICGKNQAYHDYNLERFLKLLNQGI